MLQLLQKLDVYLLPIVSHALLERIGSDCLGVSPLMAA